MDESQIQAQVAKNIPQEPTSSPAPQTDETPQESAFDSNIELNIETLGVELNDYFMVSRVDRWNEDTQRQLKDIYKWAATKAQSTDIAEVMSNIRVLETELGIIYKPNRLQRLARWVELERQTEAFRLQQEMIRHA